MHLSRIAHDHVARRRLDVTEDAPRTLEAGRHDADAVLIVRMPWKRTIGIKRHRFDASDGGSVQDGVMDVFRHYGPVGSWIVWPDL